MKIHITNEIKETADYYYQLIFGDAKQVFKSEGKYGPVIGIHGVFGGWLDDSIKKYFALYNVNSSLPNFGGFEKGINYYLPLIDKEVNKYKAPLLLGFSTGGLALIKYAEKYGWNNFTKIITVGAPFRGVGVAPHIKLLGKTMNDISPNSNLLREIIGLKAPRGKIVSIFGKDDNYTQNPESLNMNWPKIILPAKSHGDLQNHYKWIEKILNDELGITPS